MSYLEIAIVTVSALFALISIPLIVFHANKIRVKSIATFKEEMKFGDSRERVQEMLNDQNQKYNTSLIATTLLAINEYELTGKIEKIDLIQLKKALKEQERKG